MKKHFLFPVTILFLLVICFPTFSECAQESPFSPYAQNFPNGKIDWDAGCIYGVGKGYLHKNGGSKARALRAAQTIALDSILKIAASVQLNAQHRIDSIGGGRVVRQLKALIRYEEADKNFVPGKEPYFEVTRRVNLKGVEGLTAGLLKHFETMPRFWKDFPRPSADEEDREDTWLVLDARKLKRGELKPALFPKIMDSSGNILYELKQVEAASLSEKGMVRYVLSDLPADGFRSQGQAGMLRQISALLSVREAGAEEDKDKEKRKKRKRFIVKEVSQAEGLAKTNLIVSDKDAKDLKKEDASSKILKKCRVIVVANSPVGGMEGFLEKNFLHASAIINTRP